MINTKFGQQAAIVRKKKTGIDPCIHRCDFRFCLVYVDEIRFTAVDRFSRTSSHRTKNTAVHFDNFRQTKPNEIHTNARINTLPIVANDSASTSIRSVSAVPTCCRSLAANAAPPERNEHTQRI